jgi:hypothetical protein
MFALSRAHLYVALSAIFLRSRTTTLVVQADSRQAEGASDYLQKSRPDALGQDCEIVET